MSAVPEVENGNTYNGCIPCRENTSGTKDAGEVQVSVSVDRPSEDGPYSLRIYWIVKTAIENDQNLIVEGCYIPAEWRRDIDQRYLEHIKFICLAMSEEYIEDHFDAIIVHESEVENRLIKADCTADGLKQCNRWFIDLFSSVGENGLLICLAASAKKL